MERSQILEAMGELKLFGMRGAYDEIVATAVKRQHEPQKVVGDLLGAEISEKQARSIKYQMTIAKLPLAKDIDDFDFDAAAVNETLVRDLAGGGFMEQQRNVVLIGGTGTGKSHAAIAIARACIRRGARGRFFNVVDLVNKLEAETRAGRQGRIADHLTRLDFVVLDELGYPILLMTLPGIAGQVLALNMIVENLVMIPLILILAERARSDHPAGTSLVRMILRRLATNPIVLALLAGLVVAVLAVDVPGVLARAIDLLARSSAAVSLIVIGGSLVGLPLGGLRAAVAPVVVGKLFVHPLMVGLAFAALPLFGRGPVGDGLLGAGILMAAMPPMGIYPILAQRYGVERVAAVAMLATTLLSFFTISVAPWWILG